MVNTSEKSATKTRNKRNRYLHAMGKRKTSIASVRLLPGNGAITINGKDIKDYIKDKESLDIIRSPLNITDNLNKFDVIVVVTGGGLKSQSEAIRLGISKCLIKKDISYKPDLKKHKFLTRDPRIKERKKPGLKGARRAPQWSKR